MALTQRQRGDYHEHRTRDALEALGWTVTRAAGSLGPADLVALRAGDKPLLVSCKLSGRIDPGEREQLHTTARRAGARPLVASRDKPGWIRVQVVRWDSPDDRSRLEDVDRIRAPRRRKADDDAAADERMEDAGAGL
jgi:Holliday junction resolvase